MNSEKEEFLRDVYVRTRNKLPESIIRKLKGWGSVMKMAKALQPPEDEASMYTLEKPLKGYRMRIPSSCVYPMVWGDYERGACRAIENFVKAGDFVVDVGAHVGYHTLLLALHVGNSGKVYSFEPLPKNLGILRENITLNDCEGVVAIENMAVADRTCLERLFSASTDSQFFLGGVPEEVDGNRGFTIVPACSLDDYFSILEFPPVHFIKMDIEGSESRAIAGMHELINRHKPVFLVETHGEVARDGIGYLLEIGYEIGRLRGDGSTEKLATNGHVFGNEHYILLP